jgi:hypothetical protein
MSRLRQVKNVQGGQPYDNIYEGHHRVYSGSARADVCFVAAGYEKDLGSGGKNEGEDILEAQEHILHRVAGHILLERYGKAP